MSGNNKVVAGEWRSHASPMQIVSGSVGKEKVHFEAPSSAIVPKEMKMFIDWFNQTAPGQVKAIQNAIVRSALAHLYFESIHPFQDGNGRIGRAISEKALSQGLGQPIILSLSSAIEKKRDEYYKALKNAQSSNEVTKWIVYFSRTIVEAQKEAKNVIDFSLKKASFFDNHTGLNKRQIKVINRLFQEGPNGYEGGMNAKKYMSITKTSKATATRDLQALSDAGIFISVGAGRSVRYGIKI
jgi:Fic family protein